MKSQFLFFIFSSSIIMLYSCGGGNNTPSVNDTSTKDDSEKNIKPSTPEKTNAELIIGTWEKSEDGGKDQVILKKGGHFTEVIYNNDEMTKRTGEYDIIKDELIITFDDDKEQVIKIDLISVTDEKLIIVNRRGKLIYKRIE
jgi:hypothetical protein